MAKSSVYENDWLKLIFNATPIANIADNAASAPLTNLYVSLHTADPSTTAGSGTVDTQNASEAAYTGYSRAVVARTSGGWTVTGSSVSPAATIGFPGGTGGGGTATYFGVGTAPTGTGKLLYSGTVTPNIVMGNGITPQLKTDSTITES